MNHKKNKKKKRKASSDKRKQTKKNTPLNKLSTDSDSELKKALQYHQSGQLQKAEEIYQKILHTNPNHADSLHLLGVIDYQVGKIDTAVIMITKAIRNNPENPYFYNNLGNALKDQGKLNEAISHYQKALELKPDYAEACNNLGNTFKDQGMLNEAISFCKKALKLKPDLPEAYNNMGSAFKDQKKLTDAVLCYQKALENKPEYAAAHNNLGTVFKDQGKLNEAISCFKKALTIKPNLADINYNLGNALKEQGRFNEAVSSYQKTLKIKPDFAEAYNNMGAIFQEREKSDIAVSCYQKTLECKPDYVDAYRNLFHQLQQTCAWQKLEDMSSKLDDFTKKDLEKGIKTTETPFMNLMRHTGPSRNFAIAKSWSNDIESAISNLDVNFSHHDRKSHKAKIAVGYLSNDFQHHAMAHLTLSLYGLHNRDEFEIFCYSYGKDDGSYYRKRIQQDCDKFVDIRHLNHTDAARCIYEDRVGILIDLKGYTRGNRMKICAPRPAPIQVRYLGLPCTTGAEFFDYIITDRIAMPEHHAQYYSENFVYMPHCYQINDHTQRISNKDWKKMDFGLPESGFVFCSFNQGYKIEPVMFNSWMSILRQVPESILWLQRVNETAENNLRMEAEVRGVKPDRLIFAHRLPKDEHLARLKLADLALDTRIVNGIITTSDSLWAGVPVVTLQGNNFVSRVSSSILTAIGLPELITNTLEDYESIAIDLARNPGKLQTIRRKIMENRTVGPLFDTPRFTRNLEKAYKEMWETYNAGESPRQIKVVEN